MPAPDELLVKTIVQFEAALARAERAAGLVPAAAADAIFEVCMGWDGDVDAILDAVPETLTPVVPLLDSLRERLPGEAAQWLHFGATSQDAVDTAVSLLCAHGIDAILEDLDGIVAACAVLADRHGAAVMTGRTLLQPALPITFGAKVAAWSAGVAEARTKLAERRAGLAVQLGGPVGTLSELGDAGPRVVELLAADLHLAAPPMSWHTNRVRLAEAAAGLGVAAGSVAKIALDIVLLSQGEVGEVSEPAKPGRGASSAMAHKRNPVLSIGALASARRTPGLVATVLACMVQEHERAAGAWQAEWPALSELLQLTADAAARVREAVGGLEVDEARMHDNARRLLDLA